MKPKAKKIAAAAVSLSALLAVSVLHVPAPIVAAVQNVLTSLTQEAPANDQAPQPD